MAPPNFYYFDTMPHLKPLLSVIGSTEGQLGAAGKSVKSEN